jgi:hypothetical protein
MIPSLNHSIIDFTKGLNSWIPLQWEGFRTLPLNGKVWTLSPSPQSSFLHLLPYFVLGFQIFTISLALIFPTTLLFLFPKLKEQFSSIRRYSYAILQELSDPFITNFYFNSIVSFSLSWREIIIYPSLQPNIFTIRYRTTPQIGIAFPHTVTTLLRQSGMMANELCLLRFVLLGGWSKVHILDYVGLSYILEKKEFYYIKLGYIGMASPTGCSMTTMEPILLWTTPSQGFTTCY